MLTPRTDVYRRSLSSVSNCLRVTFAHIYIVKMKKAHLAKRMHVYQSNPTPFVITFVPSKVPS